MDWRLQLVCLIKCIIIINSSRPNLDGNMIWIIHKVMI